MTMELLRLGAEVPEDPSRRYALLENDEYHYFAVDESVFEGFEGDVKSDRTVALSRLDEERRSRVKDALEPVDPFEVAESIEEGTRLSEQESKVYVLAHDFLLPRREVCEVLDITGNRYDEVRRIIHEKIELAEETAALERF